MKMIGRDISEVVLRGEYSMRKKKNLLNYCGLLGVVAFLSYTAAVVLMAFLQRLRLV